METEWNSYLEARWDVQKKKAETRFTMKSQDLAGYDFIRYTQLPYKRTQLIKGLFSSQGKWGGLRRHVLYGWEILIGSL